MELEQQALFRRLGLRELRWGRLQGRMPLVSMLWLLPVECLRVGAPTPIHCSFSAAPSSLCLTGFQGLQPCSSFWSYAAGGAPARAAAVSLPSVVSVIMTRILLFLWGLALGQGCLLQILLSVVQCSLSPCLPSLHLSLP